MKNLKFLGLIALFLAVNLPAFGVDLDHGLSALKTGKYAEALKILIPIANGGDDEAQRILGEMCYKGQGMKRDLVASFKWTEVSASNGNKIAQYNLGYLYEKGEGVASSSSLAIDWYTKAAIQGYVLAQHKLGDLYASSDRNKAIYWYDAAAQRGDDVARKQFSSLSSARADDSRVAQQRADAEKKEQERLEEIERLRERNERSIREAQEQQSTRDYNAAIGAQIRQRGAQDAALLNRIDRQTNAASANANRKPAEQATERDRARAERESQKHNDADRDREARVASTTTTTRDAVRDNNSQQTVAAQRSTCIFENRTNSSDYSEAVARASLQKEINGVRALTQNSAGDPARYLSDSGITCQKEATNINPEYKCVVSIKTEVKLFGSCGKDSATAVRAK